MKILHISTDFPDSFAPQKTHAIKNLVDATADDFDHIVYSLNRVAISPAQALTSSLSGWKSQRVATDSYGPVWSYDAPGKGLYLRSSLEALGDAIAEELQKNNVRPDLVIGHKLSMEGHVAARIAKLLDIPYALCIQGNTDRNILNIRRDLWRRYRRIFHDAAMVFPFAPWALEYCEKALGERAGPTQMLPCISGQELLIAPTESNGRLMTAFHLRHREIKNLDNMLRAANRLDDGAVFDIYGGGEDGDVEAVEKAIAARAPDNAALKGAVAHDDMQAMMNSYAGFAMISRKESFGLVYIEALMAGCPVAYTKSAAIGGYFTEYDFAIAVPANNVGAIADAMARQLADERHLKTELLKWQQSGAADQFRKATIAEHFRDGLRLAAQKGQ